jgi:hypothetical protein
MARKKVIDLDTYNALDAYSIGLHEYYKSLRRAGFSIDICLALISDRESYPDWLLPDLPNRIEQLPYDDED